MIDVKRSAISASGNDEGPAAARPAAVAWRRDGDGRGTLERERS
ncbi:hypothetical protein [Pseudonocardia yuanmonensis]